MAKLIISFAFLGAFAVFLAFKFAAHHAKQGIQEARKAVDAIDISVISPALDADDDRLDTAPEGRKIN